MTRITGIIKFGLLATLLAFVAACGGSSGGDGAPQTGQVSVVITDGPTDIYERVLITLSSMTLIGNGGHEVIYEGREITFDLLQLRDRADFAFSQQIAVGDYNKIRLEVTEVRLVDLGDLDDPEDDIEVDLKKLPANGKIDLNPQGPFTVVADQATVVELDIDALRSFQVVETGNGGLRFRPIIFVNVYDDEIVLPDRMTRVFGTVREVDEAGSSLELCNLQPVAQFGTRTVTDTDSCVRVFADEQASHFDAEGMALADFDGLAAAIADLEDQTGEPAPLTAIGFPSLPDGVDEDVVLNLDAVVTELGPRKTDGDPGWETTSGAIFTDPPDMDCTTAPCSFQPEMEADALPLQLQPETRVFARDGSILDQSALGDGVAGAFDGLRVDPGGGEEMRAALFITDTFGGSELVTGILTGVTLGEAFDTLTVQTDANDPLSVQEVCVYPETDLLQVLVDDESITIVDLLDPAVLDPGDMPLVEASGERGNGSPCYLDANVVIVE